MADEGLLSRTPPHSDEAEVAVLGACMIDPEAAALAIESLKPGDFYDTAHALLFGAVRSIYDSGRRPDLVTMQAELEGSGSLDRAGGASALRRVSDAVPTSANVEDYVEIVRDRALLRELLAASARMLEEIHNGSLAPREVLDAAERRIYDIASARAAGRDVLHVGDVLKDTFRQLEETQAKGAGIITGLPTGFTDLDAILGGLQPGDLIIIAGRPSMGKSTLGMNMALNIAAPPAGEGPARGRAPVLIFSLEMNAQQVTRNMLCAAASVDGSRMRRNFLRDEEWGRLSTVGLSRLSEAPVYIDDTPAIGALELRAKARRMKSRFGIELIIVDYLQLIAGGRRIDSREQEVAEVSRSLKAIARELNVPLIAMSQLNRRAEDREGNRPRLSDLRESGAIEQDADVVMMIHRPDYYAAEGLDDDSAGSPTKVIVAKQRNGPTGEVDLTFLRSILRFANCRSEDKVREPV